MKSVVLYETGNTPMESFKAAFPRHKAVSDTFIARKEILGIGNFDGGKSGSMAIFKDRASAEAFVKEDPFVLEGLVVKYTIKEWNDVLIG